MPTDLERQWYVIARSADLKRAPVKRLLLGQPIALFRGESGAVGALGDSCPHRGYPLSSGTVIGEHLRCNYHGWRFGPSGTCEQLPGLLPNVRVVRQACSRRYAVREQDGLIWLWGAANDEPQTPPLDLPLATHPRYGTDVLAFEPFGASADLILDNFMDSAHPPFVHPGLLNSDVKRFPIDVEIRPHGAGLECAYFNEPFGDFSWFIKLFGKNADRVQHFERYLPPSIHQFEYQLGDHSHFVSTQFLTPETDHSTRIHVVYHARLWAPWLLARLPLRALFRLLLWQDRRLLERLQRNLAHVGEQRFASTALDTFGLMVLKHRQKLAAGGNAEISVRRPVKFSVHL